MSFNIKFVDADKFAPSSGGGGDLFSHDGTFGFELMEASIHEKKDASDTVVSHSLKLTAVCTDADNQGRKVITYVGLTGVQQKGKHVGRPNVMQFYQLLYALGKTTADIAALNGKEMSADDAIAFVKGKKVFAFCGARQGDGYPWKTNIISWVSEEEAKKTIALSGHRKPLPAGAQAQLEGNVTSAPNGAVGATTSALQEPVTSGQGTLL